MSLMTYTLNDATVIAPEGELDAVAVSELRPHFEALAGGERPVVADLSAIHFIDSSGVGALVFLYKRLLARGLALAVVGAAGQPLELFGMLHIDRSIPCYGSLKEYLSHGQSRRVA